MKKWNLIIDVALCENCNNCVLATKDEYVENDFPGYSAPQPRHGHEWIKIERKVRGEAPMVDAAYLPTTCNQCADAPCVKGSINGAVYQRDDGIVIIDPVKSKGQKGIVGSCPYGAITWNEDLSIPQKWIFDAHLLDQGWKEPRCVQACPTRAMQSLKISDAEMAEKAIAEGLVVVGGEHQTKPRVYYKNLYRFNQAFIGGSISALVSGRDECIPGATVELIKDGKAIAVTETDSFGDFKFDRLNVNSGLYKIEISHPQYGKAESSADVGESSYVGVLNLV